MLKKIALLTVLLALWLTQVSAQDSLFRPASIDTSRLKLMFAGDMMGHMPLVTSCLKEDSSFDYNPVFDFVRPYFAGADFVVANLEVPLAGKPYAGYPQFSSPDAVAVALKNTGFNILITANNHALDRGKQGLERTIWALDSVGMKHTGTFRNVSEKASLHPLFVEKNHIKLAILNYTYGTNGFSVQKPDIVNYIDTAEIRKDIQFSHLNHADFIIVTLHWGIEYERFPNLDQRKVAEFIRNLGADAIIGAHPHVVQPVERFTNLHNPQGTFPVVFSMGNFVSNQRDRYKDGGIVVELDLEKCGAGAIKSCTYLPVWVYKGIYQGKMIYRLIAPQELDTVAATLKMSDQDKARAQQFFNDTQEHLNNIGMIRH